MKRPFQMLRNTYLEEGLGGLLGAAYRRTLLEAYCVLLNNEFRSQSKRIWVHIGAHKTGSTTVQELLHANRNQLRRYSIYYDVQGYHLAKHLLKNSPLSDHAIEELKREWRARIDRRRARIIVLSGESFSGDMYRGYENVKHVAEDLRRILQGQQAEIVAVVRRQDRWTEAVYQQFVKGGRTATFAEFRQHCGPFPVHWDQWIAPYVQHFGREHVHVRLYEQLFEKNKDVVATLFNGLGNPIRCKTRALPHKNPGVSQTGLEILRRCNDLLQHDQAFQLRRWVAMHFPASSGPRYTYFSDQARQDFLRQCCDSNTRFLRMFFPDQDPSAYLPQSTDPERRPAEQWDKSAV